VTVSEDVRASAEQQTEFLAHDPEMQEEWVRQDNLIQGGLMAIGIVMMQPFLSMKSLDPSATTCVIAWAVAIPLLAALLMVNRQETFRRRRADSRTVAAARAVTLLAACVGLVAGFWHIHWIAGVVVLASALVATGVHSAGFIRLDLGTTPALLEAKQVARPPASEKGGGPRTAGQADDAQ
jgi:uncharacterized membrane protein